MLDRRLARFALELIALEVRDGLTVAAMKRRGATAAEVTITDEDRKAVDHIVRPGTHISPYYEADFGPHPFRV